MNFSLELLKFQVLKIFFNLKMCLDLVDFDFEFWDKKYQAVLNLKLCKNN